MSAWFSIFMAVAVKSIAVLCVAWLAAFLLRGRSAAARHLAWTSACAALIALPLLTLSLPALPVPMASSILAPDFAVQSAAASKADAPGGGRPRGVKATPGAGTGRLDWRMLLVMAWSVGVVLAFANMLAALAAIGRVRRRAHPSTIPDVGALTQALGIRNGVEVLETGIGSMPMTTGFLKPAIFLPADACAWSGERRRIVLLHELAHIRRGDVATHLLARAALCLYWWNPLAWIAWREFLKERERAADDLVLSAGATASEYASHLLDLARSLQTIPVMEAAAVAMVRQSQLEGRLRAILNSGLNRKAPGRAWVCAAALLAAAVIAPLAALQAPEDLAQEEMTRRFLDSQLESTARSSGRQSPEYGLILFKIGELERRRGNAAEAETLYQAAAQALGGRPEAATALLRLGTAAAIRKDFAKAMQYFEQAKHADSTQAGLSMMWMAVVRQAEQNINEADALFRGAIALQDPNSPDAAVTRKVFAQFLRQQGREEEAGELERSSAASPNPRPNATPTAGVYRIGGDVKPPVLIEKKEPEYTEEARLAKLAGTSVLSVEIWPDGLAHNPRIVRSIGLGLDEKAIDAIRQWRFRPGTKEGQPVAVAATIEVNFKLL